MNTFTISDIRSWRPCYDPSRHLPESWSGTAVDILKHGTIPPQDKLWVVLREECIDKRIRLLFAVKCARTALALIPTPDPRSVAACDVAERFANGEATQQELDAADAAADIAARAAAWAAARAADAAAWATAAAAARAADAAADAAAWAAAAAARAADAAADIAARAAAWAAARAADAAAWAAAWAADAAADVAAKAAREDQIKQLLILVGETP